MFNVQVNATTNNYRGNNIPAMQFKERNLTMPKFDFGVVVLEREAVPSGHAGGNPPKSKKVKTEFTPEIPGQWSEKTNRQFEKAKLNLAKFNGELKAKWGSYSISMFEPKQGHVQMKVANVARGFEETTTYAFNSLGFDRIWKSTLRNSGYDLAYHSFAPKPIECLEETKALDKLFKKFFKVLKKVK